MSFSFTLATHSFRRSVVKLPSPLHHLAGFNAFWYAHHLLVFAYILLVMHSYFIFLTKQWYKRTVLFLHMFRKSINYVNLMSVHKN
jgi:predicted ferric reductase